MGWNQKKSNRQRTVRGRRANAFHYSSFPYSGFSQTAEIEDGFEGDERCSIGDLLDECFILWVIWIDNKFLVSS